MKRITACALALVITLTLLSVSAFAAVDKAKSVTITGRASVGVDDTVQLDFRYNPSDLYYEEVEWESSNYNIASVDDGG